jgi:hypothetical protein
VPKPSDDIQDLKRVLVRLDRLGGRALACADGVFLIEPGAVRDPRPLVRACVEGRLLDALERSGAHRDPALRAAATGLKAWGADEDHATRYAWLRACVKER